MSSRLTKILFFAQCLPFYVLLYFSDCGWSVVSVPWCCCGCNIYRVTGKILLVVKPVCVFEVSIQRQSFYVVSLFFYMNYMIFIYLQSFIHLFTGLFGTNLTTSNHLASQLSQKSTTPVSPRSQVLIPYRREFFPGLIFTTA